MMCDCRVSGADDSELEDEHRTTFLDGDSMRSMYRSFRDFAMRIIGQTGRRTRGAFLQETDTKFPCNVTGMRSSIVPNSVHHLRPGRLILHLKLFYCNQIFIVFAALKLVFNETSLLQL